MTDEAGEWRVWRSDVSDASMLAQLDGDAFGARSWGGDSLRESYVAPGVTILMGGRGRNSPAGFALWRVAGDEAELLTIGVAPIAQRQGLGEALLMAVMTQALRAGARALFLEVDAGNSAAIALYKQAGFIEKGRRKKYYRDGADALLMSKMLIVQDKS